MKALVRQTVIFDKLFWRKAAARNWLRRHGYKYGDVDEKANTYRFRQRDPSDFDPKSFRTLSFMSGLKVVFGHVR